MSLLRLATGDLEREREISRLTTGSCWRVATRDLERERERSCLIVDSFLSEREVIGDLEGDLEGERAAILACFAGGERERELEYDRRLLVDFEMGERERD